MMAKKTILFICPYPIGHSPSQRFRFEQYFDLLKERGVHISIHPFWDRTTWKILYNRGNIPQKVIGMLSGFWRRLLLLFSVRRADLVFIHREATPIGPPFIEFVVARILKRRIIYDFDDAIWLPDPSVENKSAAFLKWHTKVGAICRWSYKVSCGNEYLCAFAGQFNKQVILNPTTIDTENLHNPALYENNSDSNLITIGWTGTHSTLKYLETLQPVLIDVERKFDGQIKFLVISNRKPELKIQSLQFIPWSKETEIRDLLKIQIGIMPLTENCLGQRKMWVQGIAVHGAQDPHHCFIGWCEQKNYRIWSKRIFVWYVRRVEILP